MPLYKLNFTFSMRCMSYKTGSPLLRTFCISFVCVCVSSFIVRLHALKWRLGNYVSSLINKNIIIIIIIINFPTELYLVAIELLVESTKVG
jgi:hypothetical protein